MGPLAAPIIGAVGSLLGGFLSKPKNEYVVPDYAKIRRKAEAAGFNPLFAMANAPGQVVQSQGYMGSAVSDAAMILADAVAKRPGAGKLSQVQAQNRALSKQVQSLTLRPIVGGIYAQRGVTPSLRKSLGVPDGSSNTQPSGVSVRGQNPRSNGVDVVAPEQRNTFQTYYNNGQSTDVPLGPDIDEVITGAIIAANNRDKARKQFRASPNMEWGNPLSVPFGFGVSRIREIMPPSKRYPDKVKRRTSYPLASPQFYTHPQTGFTAKRYKP
ncbi:hypothetical protein [Cypionkella sp.]|uniref:hypothetical protein n=1 Tax=Cypionkella sp. TaxID=2811411 RepID=UPI002ABA8E28|nr:hypothetical protein [Cypionkella sp.]MDZ4393447.1 hypothetical protein [Cypionkella sp.]